MWSYFEKTASRKPRRISDVYCMSGLKRLKMQHSDLPFHADFPRAHNTTSKEGRSTLHVLCATKIDASTHILQPLLIFEEVQLKRTL